MATLVSYLTVTNRPEFLDWLLWNYKRQSYKHKEHIILDNTDDGVIEVKGATVIRMPGANVPTLRNAAITAANGDYITWFDDDDWHHPDSIKTYVDIVGDHALGGGRVSWFVNLQTERVKRFVMRKRVLNASMIMRTDVARQHAFNEDVDIASDTHWLDEIYEQHSFAFTYDIPSFFLSHTHNMGNTIDAHHFNRDIDDIQSKMTKKAWGATSKQLEKLRNRLWR